MRSAWQCCSTSSRQGRCCVYFGFSRNCPVQGPARNRRDYAVHQRELRRAALGEDRDVLGAAPPMLCPPMAKGPSPPRASTAHRTNSAGGRRRCLFRFKPPLGAAQARVAEPGYLLNFDRFRDMTGNKTRLQERHASPAPELSPRRLEIADFLPIERRRVTVEGLLGHVVVSFPGARTDRLPHISRCR